MPGGEAMARRSGQLRFLNEPRRRGDGCTVGSFRILENPAFEIPNDNPVGIPAQNILWIHGNLSAAARSVDDVLWHGISCREPAQAAHDLEPLSDTRPQMRRAGDEVALVDVVRLDPAHQEFLYLGL